METLNEKLVKFLIKEYQDLETEFKKSEELKNDLLLEVYTNDDIIKNLGFSNLEKLIEDYQRVNNKLLEYENGNKKTE